MRDRDSCGHLAEGSAPRLVKSCQLPECALSPESAKAIVVGENDERIKALSAALVTPDDNLSNLVDALLGDTAKIAGDQVLIVNDGKAVIGLRRECLYKLAYASRNCGASVLE